MLSSRAILKEQREKLKVGSEGVKLAASYEGLGENWFAE